MAPLDFSPLERELTREEGQRFRREASEGVYGERARAEEDSQRAGCSCAAAGLGLFLVGLALVGLVVVVAQGEADAGWFSLFLIVPGLGLLVAARFLGGGQDTGPWARRKQLVDFARVNGLGLALFAPPADREGMVFHQGPEARGRRDVVTWERDGQVVEIGTVEGTGGQGLVDGCGYLEMDLGGPVPHLVLDTAARPALSLMPQQWEAETQIIERTGERPFRIYGPPGAEAAAARVFTPELIDLLSDPGSPRCAETRGSTLLVYQFVRHDVLSADQWRRHAQIVDTVLRNEIPPPAAVVGATMTPRRWGRSPWWNWLLVLVLAAGVLALTVSLLLAS
ncbi:hypothetical protein [Ornithinicoccus hortensis]|uniref:Uncharacterized protein n=1 Tax=Ornithinicoccus hortensis TaxID=82346 RepID=A0A542YQW0_9MICO|nr:hypothetical protein [Ornithinicoccus hortensis]TQL50478.1 hypothetical protein FB467_1588 [Ornithinicoccus hortensis]